MIFDSKYLEKNKKYTLVLGKQTNKSEQHTFGIWTDSEGNLLPLVVTLDPYETDPEEQKKKLQLGEDYSPLSLTGEGRPYSVALVYYFSLPDDPPRTVGIATQTLNKRKNELTITIQGRLLESSISSVSLMRGSRVIQSTSVDFISSEMVEATFAVGFVETDDTISFGEEYTLLSVAGQEDVAVREGVVVVVPSPPFVSSITASPHPSSPTQFSLIFEGHDLPSNFVLIAHIDSFPAIPVTVSADGTSGTTTFLNGGDTTLMGMSKTYTVSSLTMENDTDDHILLKQNSFTTPPGPEALQLIVNSESSDTTRQCGSSTSPCQSVDVAWVILSELGIRRPTIAIQTAAQLESSLQISERISLTFTKDGSKLATLSIPSTATPIADAGLIVVEGGILSIEDVHVVIESTNISFVFVSANTATISLKGSFSGHATSTNSMSNDDEDEVCSWRSGVFQLDDCSTSVTFCTFSNLSQGAIQMRNGTLNIDTTAFHDNSPNLASFASLRRNIHCRDGGNVIVGTLSGGDGVETASAWTDL
ncbi:hypothetical protein BLNAU_18450 [Blattamonas nauphoetae]|uniref:Uncharacterized protein n=1 Tax=Blattamonas nauphoetae TaxID=2049346 RepID=A0ABQ9X5K7_9EUKA|nr:hypothetical protein BLNAU_18450 [Blattamonas nauphoetae]